MTVDSDSCASAPPLVIVMSPETVLTAASRDVPSSARLPLTPCTRTSPLTFVTLMSPDTVRRSTVVSAGTFTLNSTSTPRPSPLAVLDAQLDAVAGGVGFDERIRQPLLRLFGIRPPRVLQRLDLDALAAARP